MSSTTTQFQNDNLQVTMEKCSGCLVKLDIFVTPKASQAAYAKAVKLVNKEVSLPGFRKGKAPEPMLVQNYGKYIDSEWRDVLVQTAFSDALELVKVYPFTKESVKRPQLKKITKDEGAAISVEFEAHPAIPDVEPEGLNLTRVEQEAVQDEDVDNYLENLRLKFSQWDDVADRGVEEGDYVDLDIESLDSPGQMICSDTRFIVQEGKMGNWMRKLIAGVMPGQSVEGTSEREQESSDAKTDEEGESAFKPTRCKITVKSIKNPVKPELDDELAKKTGASDVADLREKVKNQLNAEAEQRVQDKLKLQIEKQLVEKYSFDIPSSLTEHEKKVRVQQKIGRLDLSGKSKEEAAEIRQKIEEEVGKNLEQQFRLFFLARSIAEKNHLHVSQQEIIQEMMHHMWLKKNEYDSLIDEAMDPDEVRSKIYVNVLTQKALAFLVEKAQK